MREEGARIGEKKKNEWADVVMTYTAESVGGVLLELGKEGGEEMVVA